MAFEQNTMPQQSSIGPNRAPPEILTIVEKTRKIHQDFAKSMVSKASEHLSEEDKSKINKFVPKIMATFKELVQEHPEYWTEQAKVSNWMQEQGGAAYEFSVLNFDHLIAARGDTAPSRAEHSEQTNIKNASQSTAVVSTAVTTPNTTDRPSTPVTLIRRLKKRPENLSPRSNNNKDSGEEDALPRRISKKARKVIEAKSALDAAPNDPRAQHRYNVVLASLENRKQKRNQQKKKRRERNRQERRDRRRPDESEQPEKESESELDDDEMLV